jgi:hypothetical protein
MKLSAFHSEHPLHIANEGFSATRDHMVGVVPTEDIEVTPNGVVIRRGKFPDVIFTAFGWGVLDTKAPGQPAGLQRKK